MEYRWQCILIRLTTFGELSVFVAISYFRPISSLVNFYLLPI